jgi:hypothetical protein
VALLVREFIDVNLLCKERKFQPHTPRQCLHPTQNRRLSLCSRGGAALVDPHLNVAGADAFEIDHRRCNVVLPIHFLASE